MGESEMALKINVAPLRDFFSCPVCMGRLRETHTTSCGHRYCGTCIKECINRLHRCPCCNQQLTQDQLIKDAQFDALVVAVNEEESEAEKQYFSNLIDAATLSAIKPGCCEADQVNASGIRKLFSPIEQVLKEHLKHSLTMHENFYKDLQRDLNKQRAIIEDDLKQSIERLKAISINDNDLSDDIKRLEESAEKQKAALDAEMFRCAELVSGAYDRYLSERIPSLAILPVTVSVSLINKGVSIADVRLKPQDSIEDLKRIIADEMSQRGDKLMSFEDNVQFLCFGPFAKRSLLEMTHIARDFVERHTSTTDVVLLPNSSCPVMQFAIRPGSEIAVYGTVKFESDMPKICFLKTFKPDEGITMDYFSCANCKINWICRPCMDVCHKDHDVKPYIFGHQPKWACCYCVKKKNCKIQT